MAVGMLPMLTVRRVPVVVALRGAWWGSAGASARALGSRLAGAASNTFSSRQPSDGAIEPEDRRQRHRGPTRRERVRGASLADRHGASAGLANAVIEPVEDPTRDWRGRDQPLVSVIMIFFNVDTTFFQEAIESVLQQTYDRWELLLVDDGSSNGGTDIALRYARAHPDRVRYLEHEGHENRGPNAARNLGMRNAAGKYIALLDADDVWLPQKLEKQVGILEAQPEAGMVYGSSWEWHSWTGNPEHGVHDRGRQLGVAADTLVNPPLLVTLFLRREAETPGTCSVLIRRELVDDVGGFEESFRGIYEDQAFFYKVCLETPVFVESGRWDKYRKHPDSACGVAEAEGRYHPHQPHSGQAIFLNWLQTYLTRQNVDDPDIRRALRKALRPYRRLA
jgi:glycosyltransferase involved in cell wall biosynthesis